VQRLIGIGSPFGADSLGWLAVDLLHMGTPPGWELIKLDRPGSELLRYLQGVQRVVLIDALQGEGEPGAMRRIDLSELADNPASVSCHGFGIVEALALARALNELPDELVVIGVEIGPDPAKPILPDREKLQAMVFGHQSQLA
jgi:hydrogenase maturation protease